MSKQLDVELASSRKTHYRSSIKTDIRKLTSVLCNKIKYPVHLIWNNINATALIKSNVLNCFQKSEEFQILRNISGYAAPGQMVAIMGGSGAGKTTLLNILSNRQSFLKGMKTSGEVSVNGINIQQVGFSTFAGYLMQFDVLQSSLTAREQIEIVAKFRLYHLSQKERQAIVLTMILDMGISHCCDEIVGDHLNKKISGGEKKRVSLGIELLVNPSLLFLDEPTTGLDSQNSIKILKKVRKAADMGHTILATIHQPSSQIFKIFDHLILMGKGQILYQGSSEQAYQHFQQIGFEVPEFTNPAEFYINILSKE